MNSNRYKSCRVSFQSQNRSVCKASKVPCWHNTLNSSSSYGNNKTGKKNTVVAHTQSCKSLHHYVHQAHSKILHQIGWYWSAYMRTDIFGIWSERTTTTVQQQATNLHGISNIIAAIGICFYHSAFAYTHATKAAVAAVAMPRKCVIFDAREQDWHNSKTSCCCFFLLLLFRCCFCCCQHSTKSHRTCDMQNTIHYFMLAKNFDAQFLHHLKHTKSRA